MKGKFKVFLRTTAISSVVLLSVVFGSIGVCKAYENIRLVGFGEYKNAIEISKTGIRVLDFEINFD